MPKRRDQVEDIELILFRDFTKITKEILANTKKEADRQLAAFQAENVKKREAKRKR